MLGIEYSLVSFKANIPPPVLFFLAIISLNFKNNFNTSDSLQNKVHKM